MHSGTSFIVARATGRALIARAGRIPDSSSIGARLLKTGTGPYSCRSHGFNRVREFAMEQCGPCRGGRTTSVLEARRFPGETLQLRAKIQRQCALQFIHDCMRWIEEVTCCSAAFDLPLQPWMVPGAIEQRRVRSARPLTDTDIDDLADCFAGIREVLVFGVSRPYAPAPLSSRRIDRWRGRVRPWLPCRSRRSHRNCRASPARSSNRRQAMLPAL